MRMRLAERRLNGAGFREAVFRDSAIFTDVTFAGQVIFEELGAQSEAQLDLRGAQICLPYKTPTGQLGGRHIPTPRSPEGPCTALLTLSLRSRSRTSQSGRCGAARTGGPIAGSYRVSGGTRGGKAQ